jgi:hypothetical protein
MLLRMIIVVSVVFVKGPRCLNQITSGKHDAVGGYPANQQTRL